MINKRVPEADDTAVELVNIPDKKEAPKPEKVPFYHNDSPNYADNKETAKKALEWVKAYHDTFDTQSAWEEFEEEMDIADEMYRAAINRTQLNSDQSSNVQDTKSKIKSATYYSELRAITAGETAITLGNESDIPVAFEPIPNSEDYSEDLGLQLAKQRNATLAYTMDKSGMRDDIRKAFWVLNKYGNCAIEMQWDRRVEERMVKKPVAFDEKEMPDGSLLLVPKKFKREKKKVTVADHPKLIVHDMRNVRFDAMIDDIQQQSCIELRTQKQLSDIWGMQFTNQYKNVGDIKAEHMFMGESTDGKDVLYDRQINAGESGDADKPNTLFDVYYGWCRLPIDDDTGKWEPKSQLAHWYEYAFVGRLDGNPVCVRLSPLPYSCNEIPFEVAHALEDDKGGIHLGYSNLIKSVIAQEMTALDQMTDNITTRNQKPWIAEKGSVGIRDMTFTAAGNRVWWKKPGSPDPKEIEVQDTTGVTMQHLAYLDEYRRKIIGTNKPLMGEALGGRTSAAESISVYEQALKPALEDVKYKANQIFPFIAFWVNELWRDFGNPELTIALTFENEPMEIKPANMWGDMRVRVTAIKQFQDNILRRKEEDNFINQTLPVMVQNGVIDQKGLALFFKQVMKNRDFEDVDRMVTSVSSDYDARHVAKAENASIVFNGVYDMPKPGENHEAHNSEHKPFLAALMLLPKDDMPSQENLAILKLHIQQTDRLIEQGDKPMQGGGMEQPPTQENEPRTAGEAFGDMAGAMENMPSPEGEPLMPAGTGRTVMEPAI